MCDDEFGREEGSVVCRMLGLPGGVKIHNQAAFGEGEVRLDISMSDYLYLFTMQGPIWIKTIECWGNESSLALCPGAVWEHNYYCQHSEDVGLECLLTQDSDPGSQGGGEVGDTWM